ncbi:hypothetical protein C5B42_03660 [Candidatus Cerribacteria bacterium 'Amazon FNV 2010 28 9']|uniref:Uncharacterized protein n=1 Tax=Candidatus Cerribacteria bacterium 'Amazon FNV 2010 28 9' TaxID=2081795 RepID=A0A317JNB9_9BACT|nr:MAG: hypothetical protein C5B42_03660 [Candidatus Cerribacteria bacterium 'Amazon FNV 2010 28 9']
MNPEHNFLETQREEHLRFAQFAFREYIQEHPGTLRSLSYAHELALSLSHQFFPLFDENQLNFQTGSPSVARIDQQNRHLLFRSFNGYKGLSVIGLQDPITTPPFIDALHLAFDLKMIDHHVQDEELVNHLYMESEYFSDQRLWAHFFSKLHLLLTQHHLYTADILKKHPLELAVSWSQLMGGYHHHWRELSSYTFGEYVYRVFGRVPSSVSLTAEGFLKKSQIPQLAFSTYQRD